MKRIVILMLALCALTAHAQMNNSDVVELYQQNKTNVRNDIHIPDIDGYKTLKCDFHIHTVFSDGYVWPNIRVNEAWKNGLDAIAITDHIEYRPHKDVVIGDHNASYPIAKKEGDKQGIIVIKGSEITRSKPLGHINALFITDANALDVKDPLEAIDIARKQGAFIMWNHPGWPDDKSTMYDVHKDLLSKGKINGIEVVNCLEHYPKVLGWCRENNVAYMGNSDVHDLITDLYGYEGGARVVTLVFAKTRSEDGIKEALNAKRTAVLSGNTLYGSREILRKLLLASIDYRIISQNEDKVVVDISNNSDIEYKAEVDGGRVILPANKTVKITMPYSNSTVKITNCIIAEGEPLSLNIPQDIN